MALRHFFKSSPVKDEFLPLSSFVVDSRLQAVRLGLVDVTRVSAVMASAVEARERPVAAVGPRLTSTPEIQSEPGGAAKGLSPADNAAGPSERDSCDCPDQRDHMLPAHRAFFDQLSSSDPTFWGRQDDRGEEERSYEVFETIVSTYQEQPQLLDPVLEGLVGRLSSALLGACKDGGGCSTSAASPPTSSEPLLALERASNFSRYLWKLSSARGYKAVLRFMPCDVFSVEPVLRFLNTEGGNAKMSWECQYVLLMWSSQLVMVPFAFGVVCETQGDQAGSDVIGGLVQTCKDLLRSARKSRDMAAVCLGRLLTRHDMGEALVEFGAWAEGQVAAGDPLTSPLVSHARQFLLPGVSLAIATIFKFGKAEDETIRALVTRFVPLAVDLYDSEGCFRNPLVRKLSMKIVQRGATLVITANDVILDDNGVQELLGASVLALLSGLSDRDTIVRWSAAKGIGRLAAKLQAAFADQILDSILERNLSDVATGEDAWHGGCLAVAELARRELIESSRVEDLVPVVRDGLTYDVRRGYTSVGTNVRDAASYVCWALARTQSRDNMVSALQTLAPVLMTTACYDREVNCRRAASAAFQECVGRLGDFPHGIDILTVADFFSVSLRVSAYLDVAPLVASFDGYHRTFAEHLTNAKLSHWDKSVRELAAEALARLVPIDPEYHRTVILKRLASACIMSCTQDGTHGAAVGLAWLLLAVQEEGSGMLGREEEGLVIEAIVRLAENFQLSGSKSSGTLAGGENMRSALCRLIRSACVSGVSKTSSDGSTSGVIRHMYDVCRENLHHPADSVQLDAARALAALLDAHVDDPAFPTPFGDVLISIAGDLHPDLHFGARRGAALAFGQFPARLISRGKETIFLAVSGAVYPEEQLPVRDVETRVNAIRALPHVVRSACAVPAASEEPCGSGSKRVAAEQQACPSDGLSMRQRALEALMVAMDDYSTDNRGDVGSWAREAAASAGVDLLFDATGQSGTDVFAAEASAGQLGVGQAAQFFSKVVRLALERIGRVRSSAGRCLRRMVRNDGLTSALRIPSALVAAVLALTDEELLDGRAAARLLPICLEETPNGAANHLAPEALLGAVYAIGGLDAQLQDFTTNQLVSCISRVPNSDEACEWQRQIGPMLLALWRQHAKSGRLSGPFVQTAEAILSRTDLVSDESFVIEVVDVTLEAIHGSGDVAKLCKASSLLGTVAGVDELREARANASLGLVTLMGRKYPKVRTTAAEELYTAMLTWEEMMMADDEDGEEDLLSILAATSWSTAEAAYIRTQRLRIQEKLESILNIK